MTNTPNKAKGLGKSTIILICIAIGILAIIGVSIAVSSNKQKTQPTTTANTTQTKTSALSSTDRATYKKYCTDDGISTGACECRVNAYEIMLAKEPNLRYLDATQSKEFESLMFGCDPQTGKITQ